MPAPAWPGPAPTVDPNLLGRRQQEVLLALLLNHSFLLGEVAEELKDLELPARDLDKLCREILNVHAARPDLDAAGMRRHLTDNGFARTVDGVLSQQVLNHAAFARADAAIEAVRMGWLHTRSRFDQRYLARQIKEAERDLAEDMTEEKYSRLRQMLLEREGGDDGTAEGGIG
jgi:DNA primase